MSGVNLKPEIVLSVKNVSLNFRLKSYNFSTFKEYVLKVFSQKSENLFFKALHNVNIEVQKGECVGLIGHNGSGKSTLLRVIAGVYQCQGASISINGTVAPMIELGAGFDSELSGYENIFLSCSLMGKSKTQIHKILGDIISFAELEDSIHQPFKNYSSGMQARLGFACATAIDPDLLLVDEVLAVGDSNFSKKCLNKIRQLKNNGTSIVLVSHDENTVKEFCSRGYVFEHGEIKFEGAIFDCYEVYHRLMKERELAYLSTIDKRKYFENIEREKKLESDRKNGAEKKPDLKIRTSIIQDLRLDNEPIRLDRPFSLKISLYCKDTHLFKQHISVGFAIHIKASVRIGGLNTAQAFRWLEKSDFKEDVENHFLFHFEDGIKHISSNQFTLLVGVHDEKISRELFLGFTSEFEGFNPLHPVNEFGDIIPFLEHVTLQDLEKK